MTIDPRLRKGWAAYLIVYAGLLLAFIYPYFRLPSGPSYILIASTALDFASVWCLYQYVRRKPIPSLGIRIAVLALTFLFVGRLAIVLALLVSNAYPWLGLAEQWVSLAGIGGALFQVPMAVALASYALRPQRSPVPATAVA